MRKIPPEGYLKGETISWTTPSTRNWLMLFDEGIVVTVKQRQEFRIRLQKRARRVAERKLEAFEEERQAKTVVTLRYVTLCRSTILCLRA